MKLIIVHGNALPLISKKIDEIKQNFDPLSVTRVNGKEESFSDALMKISTTGLFSDSRILILENFDEKIELDKFVADEDLTLVIRFSKQLTEASTIIKAAHKLKAQIILLSEKDEVSVFPFLDSLGEKNSQRAFSEFEKLYPEYGGQYLLTMIFYLLRRLATTTKKAPQFVIDKLNRQKRNFDSEKIRLLYREALELDFRIKSGLVEDKIGLTLLINKMLVT